MATMMIYRWIYTCCHSQHSQQVDYTSRTSHGFRKPRESTLLYIIITSQALRRRLNVSENSTCGTWMIILLSLLLVEYEKLIGIIMVLPAIQGTLFQYCSAWAKFSWIFLLPITVFCGLGSALAIALVVQNCFAFVVCFHSDSISGRLLNYCSSALGWNYISFTICYHDNTVAAYSKIIIIIHWTFSFDYCHISLRTSLSLIYQIPL